MILVIRLFLVLCSKKCMLGKSWRLHFLLQKTMKTKLKAGKLDCIFEDPEQRHILGDNMTMTGRDSHGESSDDTDLRGFGTPRDGISRILN